MARVPNARARGREIREFILEAVEQNPAELVRRTSERFGISRQAANKHIRNLIAEGILLAEGRTRVRRYQLAPLTSWDHLYPLAGLEEDVVWSRDIAPLVSDLPRNVLDIWQFCVTEMLNNAVDHSMGTTVRVELTRTALNTRVRILDDGVGIFRKIQAALGLIDERQAILELAKGKFTTDPRTHSGQGIFFTSRMLDSFDVLSHGIFFTHTSGADRDMILERPRSIDGTAVFMNLRNQSTRSDQEVFEQYTSGDDYGFTKTVVPVRLAQYGEDKLVSRSQAKRLLARIDRFRTVIFDFKAVETIGQAFADEIFRVFAQGHPEIEITPINATTQVQQMIAASRSNWASDVGGI